MNKRNNCSKNVLKVVSLLTFSFFLIIPYSCNKCHEETSSIKEVDGLVINRVDNTPVADIEVQLILEFGSYAASRWCTSYSDSKGKFHFYGLEGFIRPYGNSFWDNYQEFSYTMNDLPDSYTFAKTEYDSDSLFNITIGLYPQTYYKIHLKNIYPASETDTLKLRPRNTLAFYERKYIGLIDEVVFEGKTTVENILRVDYDVVSNGTTESFSKTFELEPGKETDVIIEY